MAIPGLRRFFRIDRGMDTVARDLDDELRFHFDMTVEELVNRGMTPDEARREAARRFGDVDRHRESLRAIDRGRVKQRGRVELWSTVAQDVRYALRGVRMNPGLTAVVALTLGLGIGANATMFGIVDRLLLRPPAYLNDPEMVHRVYLGRTWDGVEHLTANISYKRYLELRDWTTSFSQTAAFFNTEIVFGTGEDTRELHAGLVSASYWRFFDARPVLGRFFTADEDRVPEGSPVAVLGYAYWQSKYGTSPDVIGKTLRIGRKVYTVVGVAPEGFNGMSMQAVAAYIPITAAANDLFGGGRGVTDPTRYYTTHNMSWMEMLVRRKPGVSIDAATADLTAADRRSFAAQPNATQATDRRPRAIAAPILRERGPQQGRDSKVATWLAGVSLVVLLVACANVANILLARAFRRRREIAVRMALGISRGRLLAQLFTESVVLAVFGAAAGLAVAHWGGGILRGTLLPDVEWGSTLADSRVLAFAAGIALAAGILTGLAPVLQSLRSDVTTALKTGGARSGLHRSRLRTALLVFQATLSVVLLVGAGLFVRSLRNVRTLDLGYDPDRVVYVGTEMRGTGLPDAELAALKRRLLARARQLPGVEEAGRTLTIPFWMNSTEDLSVPGIDSVNRLGDFYLHAISPGYFKTMGTRILRGRAITEADRQGAPLVIVVSQSMAKKLWPNKDALGQCVKVDTMPCSTVVGIAEDIRRGSFDRDEGLQYYLAIEQFGAHIGGLFVRTRGDASRATERIRRELQRLMPGVAYVGVTPLSSIVDREVRAWQLGATMFTIFGGLGLLLAAVGLYAVMAYNTAQRTHELGVRIALGAQMSDVVRLVVAGGVRVAVVGIAIGAAVALLGGRFIAPLLFHISPKDPWVFAVVTLTLMATALLASLVPAWRATRVDPNVALRTE